ncbi:hypothetical protein [Acinetobacter pittii]|uniref:hypothetical protein n=1 Tax=Acinetobacter pittii TaxID=48296 RepID=UPI00197D7B72|nr:hypothetical protein [Acinetobacter pittii]MBN6514497.1 hypothetical protein [Acinetobacter pittii]
MDKPQVSVNKNSVQPTTEPKPNSQSSTYVESVRMTPDRLITAVIRNIRQGGSDEH